MTYYVIANKINGIKNIIVIKKNIVRNDNILNIRII